MITRGQARSFSAFRLLLLAALMPSGLACVGVGSGDGSIHGGEGRMVEAQVRLPDAEQMIDDLDRMLTANGTIGVKSPDVWGQDRLAKFRSEYETQLSEWLKTGYKGDINASIRRSETEAHRLSVGTTLENPAGQETTAGNPTAAASSSPKSTASPSASTPAPGGSPDRTTVALEPTVVLDEHSNYLNHLNQLRRINAGDDLTDRPGYGLYLVRIPVTLSPGPRSRRGKGAIITVSAKSLMTRDTLRNTLRNTVINETVNNLTQAIGNPPTKDGEPTSGPGAGSFSLVSYADTEVFYGPRSIALLKNEAERLLARDLADEPHHRSARVADWLRGELEASYQLLEEAATPVRGGQRVAMFDPLEEVGDLVMHRDYTKLAHLQLASTQDQQVLRAGGRAAGRVEDDDPGGTPPPHLEFPGIRAAHSGRGRQSPAQAGHDRSGPHSQAGEPQENQLLRAQRVGGGHAPLREIRRRKMATQGVRHRASHCAAECGRRLRPADAVGLRSGRGRARGTAQGLEQPGRGGSGIRATRRGGRERHPAQSHNGRIRGRRAVLRLDLLSQDPDPHERRPL